MYIFARKLVCVNGIRPRHRIKETIMTKGKIERVLNNKIDDLIRDLAYDIRILVHEYTKQVLDSLNKATAPDIDDAK